MRIRNTLLAIVAVLLLLNLGVSFYSTARAVPKTQYKAVQVVFTGQDGIRVQSVLDHQSSNGWEFVGYASGVLIFKK